MAEIAPFTALRFDLTLFPDASRLLAPPYDVIGETERETLEKRHDRNIVRLDLPRGEGDQKYENARTELERWIADGSLREDPKPALYRYEQTFEHAGRSYHRKGFTALLRLTPFADRVVLPHEHTLSGPKLDRQKLIRTTRAHFSQVFTLYGDPAGETEAAFAAAEKRPADVDTITPDGCRHRLWVVSDPATITAVARLMKDRQVMIADGHHRYETMVGLSGELRPTGAAPGTSLADWGPIFFARAEDPGLLVLPTHRLVRNLAPQMSASLAALRTKLLPWFTVEDGSETTAAAIEARLEREGRQRVTLALREAGKPGTTWLGLRPDADLSPLGPPALRGLDVTVLHGLLLGPLLGVDKEAMAKQSYLTYTHDTQEALDRLARAEAQAGFFMNPTQVDQVLQACEAGFVLPQKSTYFQPKLATGLVMSRIDPTRGPARVL